ncbi:hypothetical protein LEP1GSC047_3332 [Leptospira inadai serovar Lyme str. 10]|uniref:Uncharacterized protein n=2 Tax=Leptospira inadai serovar Lyme TaxID=293084 RepID=V6HBQ8_9LEPT|nr:hypothetical protein [Leptospira inadai]EQA36118.1 hypothetical protein LEP1GSC047_3332 [Leptospira inadai serovar Lyme str. 10]PNV74889.1 hypothetical protein BES34_011505 [Leptospira inadai serovar Lyme]
MTNTEGTSFKDIFFKVGSALFLGVLVLMLIFTLLRSDVEQAGMDMLTGKANIKAGKIGGKDVPMDSFNAGRRYCYQIYQGQIPDSQLGECAFMILKGMFVANTIANSLGYSVSEELIRQNLWEEAQKRVKLSYRGAGYSDDEVEKPDQVYRQFLKEAPMRFRIEAAVQGSIQANLLQSDLRKTDDELRVQSEASTARVDLNALVYTEEDLTKLANQNVEPTDLQLRELYQKEITDSNAPKGKDGKIPSFEERKSILRGKFLIEARKSAIENLKAKIKTLQSEPNGLGKVAALFGTGTVTIRDKAFADLKSVASSKGSFSLLSDKRFFQDLTSQAFGQKKSLGPYKDADKYALVEFVAVRFGKPETSTVLRIRDSSVLLNGFLSEIPQSVAEEMTVERLAKSAEE